MDLVPALAVRLMKRRVLSRPGVYSLLALGLVWELVTLVLSLIRGEPVDQSRTYAEAVLIVVENRNPLSA